MTAWFDDDFDDVPDPPGPADSELSRAHARERLGRARAELITEMIVELERCATVADQLTRLTELLVPRLADFVTIESMADRAAFLVRHVDPVKATVLDALRRRGSSPVADVDEEGWDGDVARLLPTAPARSGSDDRPPTATSTVDDLAHASSTADLQRALGAHSRVLVPLRTNEQPLAVVLGLTDPDRRAFTGEDVAFFRDVIERAAGVIIGTEWREREQRASRRLQKALLPDVVAAHPSLDVAAHYEAASEHVDVGGDWYDTFVWPDGRYALVIGDVVGHGVEAAAAMGRLRAGIGMLVADGADDPGAVLEAIVRATRGFSIADYLTAVAIVIDADRRELSYAAAGHPPPLVIRHDGGTRWLDDGAVGPICPSIPLRPRVETVPFHPGDVVVAYTDGLVERRRTDLVERFDLLEAAARRVMDTDVADLVRRLAFDLGADPADDTVIAAIRLAPHLRRHADAIAPTLDEVRGARERLRTWLHSEQVGVDVIESVALATTEALTNAAEHSGVGPNGGRIFLRASIDPARGRLVVDVSDAGVWRRPQLDPVNRGRGTKIMERVASGFERTTGPGGTAVTLRFDLADDE